MKHAICWNRQRIEEISNENMLEISKRSLDTAIRVCMRMFALTDTGLPE